MIWKGGDLFCCQVRWTSLPQADVIIHRSPDKPVRIQGQRDTSIANGLCTGGRSLNLVFCYVEWGLSWYKEDIPVTQITKHTTKTLGMYWLYCRESLECWEEQGGGLNGMCGKGRFI